MLGRGWLLTTLLVAFAFGIIQVTECATVRKTHSRRVLVKYKPVCGTSVGPTGCQQAAGHSRKLLQELTNKEGVSQQQPHTTRRALQETLSDLKFVHVGRHTGIDILEYPLGRNASLILDTLLQIQGVEFAEEDFEVTAFGGEVAISAAQARQQQLGLPEISPDDPSWQQQWGMQSLGLVDRELPDGSVAHGAWNRTGGSDDIVVCVIDSGVFYNHPDLMANVWTNPGEIPDNGIDDDQNGYVDDFFGYDFLNNDPDPADDNFHGTHVAGIVGALCNNDVGVCGVNHKVKLMACKFLDAEGRGHTSNAVRCLEYAIANGAHVTVNSYGGTQANSQTLSAAIDEAGKQGQLFVTAAGNLQTNTDYSPTYPACYENDIILSVGAVDEQLRIANYSNYGVQTVDMSAPGTNILSTTLDGQYGNHSGTSQAAAFAGGAAALLLAAYKEAGFDVEHRGRDIKSLMMNYGVIKLNELSQMSASGGVLNLEGAMKAIPTSADLYKSFNSRDLSQPLPVVTAPPPQPPITIMRIPPDSAPMPVPGAPQPTPAAVPAPAPAPNNDLQDDDYLAGSFAQVFRQGFELQNSSLTLTPASPSGYTLCLTPDLLELPHDITLGVDVTDKLLAGDGLTKLQLGDDMPFGTGTAFWITVSGKGTIQVRVDHNTPADGGVPGFGSPASAPPSGVIKQSDNTTEVVLLAQQQAQDPLPAGSNYLQDFAGSPQIAALLSDISIELGGQVIHTQRPDRTVISFVNVVSNSTRRPSTFQVEMFYRSDVLEAGSIRISWLHVGVDVALAGLLVEHELQSYQLVELANAEDCALPPTAIAQPMAFTNVVSKNETMVQIITIDNTGDQPLHCFLSVEPQGRDILVPELWLNEATSYLQTYVENSKTCQQYQAYSDPVCIKFPEPGMLSVRGSYPRPARFVETLNYPIIVTGIVWRGEYCTDQYIALSENPWPPKYRGDPGSLWFAISCDMKFIFGAESQSQTQQPCAQYGRNHLSIEMSSRQAVFMDDQCAALSVVHKLQGPLYLYVGAACDFETCKDGAIWERLDIQAGTSVINMTSLAEESSSLQGHRPPPPPPDDFGYHVDENTYTEIPAEQQSTGDGRQAESPNQSGPASGTQHGGGNNGKRKLLHQLHQAKPLMQLAKRTLAMHESLTSETLQRGLAERFSQRALASGSSAVAQPALAQSRVQHRRMLRQVKAPVAAAVSRITFKTSKGALTDSQMADILKQLGASNGIAPSGTEANTVPNVAQGQSTVQGAWAGEELPPLDTSLFPLPVGWVSLDSPSEFIIAPLSKQTIVLHLDGGNATVGTQAADLVIKSNDPETPILRVAMQLTILP